ncbi:LysR family transcriptional regulator [Marinobacterium mangrovicola]|uniref:LysR family transcriptional regulator n=1 Tax=Marinobacterium mangrovicola TaxID=1476959 RepID=A0A4R1GKL9_9GAMM|nr:LysR family transcriptional regulator [Marinobacterium mangrovicola]TCK08977.1 LysR family transcriptional regulator [Marinobacterium mangrovicola]
MNFTLKQLRYFVLAGDHSSVTKAAEEMYVSQPSISSAIHHLETVTGLQLFIRHHAQGLTLTPQGRQFYRKSKNLLKQADDLALFATSLGKDITGNLNLVGFPTFTALMMPSILKQFITRYPEVNVHCDEMHQRDLIQGLLNSDYELAITYDMELPDSVEFLPLLSLPPYAVVSQDHPLANRKKVSLKELADLPMVMLDWPMSREYFSSLFLSQNLKPNCAHKAHSLGMVRGMVANGFGYSLFNTPAVSNVALDGSEFVSLELEDELMPLQMGIARLAQSRLTPAGNAFVEMLQSYADRLLSGDIEEKSS